LLALDYPRDRLEILVVDNNSTDGTSAIIEKYPVVRLSERKQGGDPARNRAATSARGDIIAFTDADCVVDVNWAREINRTFRDHQVEAVMGFTEGINENFWALLEQGNFEEFWFREGKDGYSLKRVGVDTRNCAIRKDVLEEYGYLNGDLRYCGDLDLSVKMRARECQVVLNESMKASHYNRTNLRRILSIKEDHARAYLQIVDQQPDGFDSPGLFNEFRTFLGLDNGSIKGRKLTGAMLGLRLLRSAMIVGLQCLFVARANPRGLALKLFKSVCGASWEIAILDEKRRQEA